jgi:hypothetical protein
MLASNSTGHISIPSGFSKALLFNSSKLDGSRLSLPMLSDLKKLETKENHQN